MRDTSDRLIMNWRGMRELDIVEGHLQVDHVHMCLSVSPKYAILLVQRKMDALWLKSQGVDGKTILRFDPETMYG